MQFEVESKPHDMTLRLRLGDVDAPCGANANSARIARQDSRMSHERRSTERWVGPNV